MTQNFNEWLKENPNKSYADIYEYGSTSFEAGAQSKQAEIDELRKRNEQAIAYIEHWYGCVELSNIVNILNGDMKWENNQ